MGKEPQVPVRLRSGQALHYAPPPGFPIEVRGFDELHAALLKESHRRGGRQQREVGNPGPELRSG
jgi:hypothetical protein